jgi:hypothetical protein
MAEVIKSRWSPEGLTGLPRRDRAPCEYEAYVPDLVSGRKTTLNGDVATDVADAERAIAALDAQALTLADTEALARILLRAESVASSRIEGLEVGARRLLRAQAALELGEHPSMKTLYRPSRKQRSRMPSSRRSTRSSMATGALAERSSTWSCADADLRHESCCLSRSCMRPGPMITSPACKRPGTGVRHLLQPLTTASTSGWRGLRLQRVAQSMMPAVSRPQRSRCMGSGRRNSAPSGRIPQPTCYCGPFQGHPSSLSALPPLSSGAHSTLSTTPSPASWTPAYSSRST